MKYNPPDLFTVKISKNTIPAKSASSIARAIKENKMVEVICIGPMASYLTVKAFRKAKDFLYQNRIELFVVDIYCEDILIAEPMDAEVKTAYKWLLDGRYMSQEQNIPFPS